MREQFAVLAEPVEAVGMQAEGAVAAAAASTDARADYAHEFTTAAATVPAEKEHHHEGYPVPAAVLYFARHALEETVRRGGHDGHRGQRRRSSGARLFA